MKRGKDTKQLSLGEKKGFFQSDGFSNAMASVLAIMVGLLFGLVALFIIRPERALQGFGLILSGSFNGGAKGIGEVLYLQPQSYSRVFRWALHSRRVCST